MRDHPWIVGDTDESAVAVHQAQKAPVERDIPDHLRRHNGRRAHEFVLVAVDVEPHFGERSEQRVVYARSCDDILTVEFAGDHVGDEAVADRDEVQPR